MDTSRNSNIFSFDIQNAKRIGTSILQYCKKAWLAIILVLLILAAALIYIMKPRHQESVLPIVEVETVDTTNVNIYGEYVGRIRAQQFVEVHARVEGYLEKMLFKEGSYIQKGQTLFIIDPRVYDAHVNKAKAQLNKAKAQAQKANRDLKRIRPLFEQNAASQLDLDNATAAAECKCRGNRCSGRLDSG